jgi:deaminated glutathione amidase
MQAVPSTCTPHRSSVYLRLVRVACLQFNATAPRDDLLAVAERLVERAAARGAELVVLPEKWTGYGSEELLHAAAEDLATGPTVAALGSWAARHGLTIVGGSITERRADASADERFSNTCVVVDPAGRLAAVYRKTHMFDVDVNGQRYRESDLERPGDELVQCDIAGWTTGLSICYDLRFPELFRIHALSGATLVTVPAAFTAFTGKDHWSVLLRARAIENQLYVVAANQHGPHGDGKASFGRSMIVDPWGVMLAQAPDEDAVIVADLDRDRLERVRAQVPALANRAEHVYRWPTTSLETARR